MKKVKLQFPMRNVAEALIEVENLLPRLCWYKIILLGDRCICGQTNCWRSLHRVEPSAAQSLIECVKDRSLCKLCAYLFSAFSRKLVKGAPDYSRPWSNTTVFYHLWNRGLESRSSWYRLRGSLFQHEVLTTAKLPCSMHCGSTRL